MSQPTSQPTSQPARSGFHPVNVAHLVFGVVFAGLALTWMLRAVGAVSHDDLGWLLPLSPIAAGVAGLTAAAVARRRPHTDSTDTTVSGGFRPARPDHEEQP